MKYKATILDSSAVERTLTRLSFEIVEKTSDPSNIILVGVKTRGVPIAKRIAANILKHSKVEVPIYELDISKFRDDLVEKDNSKIDDLEINNKEVIIVDDVLFTGRTVRAAIEAIFTAGRPAKIKLATLVDRGHRELPFSCDFVGKNIPTSLKESVHVNLAEIDGSTSVEIYEKEN